MNIVFVSIFDLTRVFYEMALELTKHGHQVSWITTDETWTAWLQAQGVAPDDILQLVYDSRDFIAGAERQTVLDQLCACEARATETVNQCLLMDRFVLYKNKPDINEHILCYYRDIKRFLLVKQTEIVFAEPTNVNELITHMVCGELKVRFVAPWDMRFPGGRVIFNDGFAQGKLATRPQSETVDIEQGRRLLEQFAEKQSVPFTFKKFSEEKVVDPRKAAKSIMNRLQLRLGGRRQSLTHHDFSERIGTAIRRIYNGFYLRHVCHYDALDEIKGKVAFFPLHVQPESSIDVKGSFFSDQLKLIKDIRRALPFDVTLVVKEHPNFLGQRGADFFRQLRRIPNLCLIRHDISSFEVYKRADLVLTITGTSAYEAGMLGLPAITFVRIYFDGLSSIHHCGDLSRLKPLAARLLDGFQRDMEADSRFMAELLSRSYEGYWTDPLFDPSVMARSNLDLLSKAFTAVVESDLT